MTYIVDLDNTLVFTDALNNRSYNHALREAGYAPIEGETRITRDTVRSRYPEMNEPVQAEVIREKQAYFNRHLEQTACNTRLLQLLNGSGTPWVIWTSAERCRADAVLRFYGLSERAKVFYTSKEKPIEELAAICKELGADMRDIVVFENDERVLRAMTAAGIPVTDCR